MPIRIEQISGGGGGAGNLAVSGGASSGTFTGLTFSNSNGVTFGLNNGTITASVGAAGAGLTNINVSAGATSLNLSALTFANSNGVSFGLSANSVITATVQTNYLTTAMASDRGTDFVQATAGFHGTNASGTIASSGISVSVAAPVAQSNQTVGLYASSNTYLTSSGTVDARSLSFRGDKSITIGISAGEVVFSVGAYLTTAMASGDSTKFVQANAAFAGTNASGTIASSGISVSVAAPIPIATAVKAVASVGSTGTVTRYAPEDHQHAGVAAIGISTSGNTAGTTGSEVGTYWIQGGNSITVSQITSNNGSHTLVISAGNYLTTAMASGASTQFVQANANFNGTNASGTIASNAISVSVAAPIPIATAVKAVASIGSTGTITRYAPEDHQHAGVAAFAVTNTGNTLGNPRSQVGTLFLAATGGITASQSTGAAGNDTVWLSVAAPVAQTAQSAIRGFGVSNTGQTAGNTGISTGIDWVLAGSQSITLSQSTAVGGPDTVWIQHPAWLTTAMVSGASTQFVQANAGFNGTNASGTIASNAISVSVAAQSVQTIGGYVVGNTTGQSSSTTFDARTISISGAGAVSVGYSGSNLVISGATVAAAPVNFSAGTTSNNLGSVVFSDSNGISWGLSGSTITGTVSTYSTVGTATTVTPVASANSVGTVTRWAAEDHRHAGVGGVGISTAGNTAGTTGSEVGTYWFQGSGAVTVSQITSNNGSHTLVVAVPSPTTYSNFFAPFHLLDGTATSTGSLSQLGVQPFTLPVNLSFGGVNMVGQGTVVPTSGSHNWSIRLTNSTQAFLFSAQYSISQSNLVDFYLFSRGSGVYSSELQTFASTRNSFVTYYQVTQSHSATLTNTAGGSIKVSQSFSMSISYPFVTSSTATSINAGSSYTAWGTGYTTWTSTASNSTSDTYSTSVAKAIAVGSTYPATVGWSGTKLLYFNFASTLSPGEYWLGVVRYSSQSSSSVTGSTITGAAGTGASYSYTYNATDLKQTQMLTYAGKTNTIANSLGSFGFVTTANMGPEFGLGTFSGTWASNTTYLNGLANPAGAIAPSQLLTGVSFFQSWFQLNSNRGGC